MKKLLLVCFILLSLSLNVFAMNKQKAVKKKDLIVFAAASMTETLNKLKPIYEEGNKNVNLVYNFDSSGTLKTQIENGANCDVFLSAAQKQMNGLQDRGLIDESTRSDLLENKTVIAVVKGNENKISSFKELCDKLNSKSIFIAIGNSDVPVGQYTKKIFDYYKVDESKIKSQLTYGSNVKEVTTQVKSRSVDAGIIYATDAASSGLVAIATANEKETGGRVIYPVSVLKNSTNKDDAKDFIEFLKSSIASDIFESVGFSIIK